MHMQVNPGDGPRLPGIPDVSENCDFGQQPPFLGTPWAYDERRETC